MSAEGKPDRNQPACYTIDMKMTQESLYHMVSVEKQLNPSAPLRVWTTFGFPALPMFYMLSGNLDHVRYQDFHG